MELVETEKDAMQLLANFVIGVREPGEGCGDTVWAAYNNRGYRQGIDIAYGAIKMGFNTRALLSPTVGFVRFLAAHRNPDTDTCEHYRRRGFVQAFDAVNDAIKLGLRPGQMRTAIEAYHIKDDNRKGTETDRIRAYEGSGIAIRI